MAARHDSNQQEVVDLLRDRIRSNALELLSRADAASTSAARTRSRESSVTVGLGAAPSKSPHELLSVETTAPTTPLEVAEEEEKKDGESQSINPSPRYDDGSNTSTSASSTSLATPTELTKRLQQLARQRQEEAYSSSSSSSSTLRVIQSGDTHLSSAKTFEELLPPHLVRGVYEMGFNRPSQIQSATLPLIFDGRNVIAQAQSGSGKTVAFSLGVMFRVQASSAQTQAVILTPTRELAIQAWEQAVKPLSSHFPGGGGGVTVQLAISGTQLAPGTKVKAHVVIGTPGKVTDWLKRRTLDVRNVRVFVLDEADSMVDGFRAKTLQIYKHLPTSVQCLLCGIL